MDDMELDEDFDDNEDFEDYEDDELALSINKIRSNIKITTESNNKTKIESEKKIVQKEFNELSSKNSKTLLMIGLTLAALIISAVIVSSVMKENNNKKYIANNKASNYENVQNNNYSNYEHEAPPQNESTLNAIAETEIKKEQIFDEVDMAKIYLNLVQAYQYSISQKDYQLYEFVVGKQNAVSSDEFSADSKSYDELSTSIVLVKPIDDKLIMIEDNLNQVHYLVGKDDRLYYLEYPINKALNYYFDSINLTDSETQQYFVSLREDNLNIYDAAFNYFNIEDEAKKLQIAEKIAFSINSEYESKVLWEALFEIYYRNKDWEKAIYAATQSYDGTDSSDELLDLRVAYSLMLKNDVMIPVELLSYNESFKENINFILENGAELSIAKFIEDNFSNQTNETISNIIHQIYQRAPYDVETLNNIKESSVFLSKLRDEKGNTYDIGLYAEEMISVFFAGSNTHDEDIIYQGDFRIMYVNEQIEKYPVISSYLIGEDIMVNLSGGFLKVIENTDKTKPDILCVGVINENDFDEINCYIMSGGNLRHLISVPASTPITKGEYNNFELLVKYSDYFGTTHSSGNDWVLITLDMNYYFEEMSVASEEVLPDDVLKHYNCYNEYLMNN